MSKKRLLKILKYTGYVLLTVLCFFLAVDWNFLFLFGKSPGFREVENPRLAVASEVYTADSVLMSNTKNFHRTLLMP
jgi:penicillin-binding protein 1A